ncbi:MAG: tyrosine-type recombinase/integrase [Acidobacteriia bacterium]|nr:tyrosine-type recombinase/integrase [Terriglobia bacterium]
MRTANSAAAKKPPIQARQVHTLAGPPGVGSEDTLTGNWRLAFRRLCEIAGVRGGHPHRFRDSLAVELLLEGIPIERVAIVLGHSSVKVTKLHYAAWVQPRQTQVEADVARAWKKDPIALAEMLRGHTASQDGTRQRNGSDISATRKGTPLTS